MIRETRVMLEFADDPAQRQLATCRANGGYEGLARALRELSPADVTEEVVKSGLRGRGGAGFPASGWIAMSQNSAATGRRAT